MTRLTVDPGGCSLVVAIQETESGVRISYDPSDSLWPPDSAEQRLLELLEGYIVRELPSGKAPGSGKKCFLTNLAQEEELSEVLIANGIAA